MSLPELPDNVIEIIFDGLEGDESALSEFKSGFGKRLHFATVDPGPVEFSNLVTYLWQWLTDVHLVNSPKWRAQVNAAEAAIAAGTPGESISTEQLGALIRG